MARVISQPRAPFFCSLHAMAFECPFIFELAHPPLPARLHFAWPGTMADYEPRGITVRDVAAADFIKAYAEHLKNTGRVELPSWCDLVKTAPHKEMCPYDQDWYYIRAGERRREKGGKGER